MRHVAGRPATLEQMQFVTYRSFLLRWLRKPHHIKRIKSKFPHRIEEGNMHTVRVGLPARKIAEFASRNRVWIAVRHSASRRPLISRFALHELSEDDYRRLWDSYDGRGNDEAEEEYYETLARIERKRKAQKQIFKK